MALLSRLHPAWFPADETGTTLGIGRARLNYPVNYWNALAAMMAIGMPLLLAVAADAKRLSVRALATAFVPIMALVAFYTFSRGGAVAVVVALAAFVFLYPRRLAALPSLLLGTLGGALLIVAATQRNALKDGLANTAAAAQADEMIAMVLVVCAGVALLSAAVGLATRHGLVAVPRPSRSATAAVFAVSIAVVVVAALAAGLPGVVSDRWTEFKQPVGPEGGNTAERFESASGNGRYQYWQTAVDAFEAEPLTGIGPGTYEYYWAREGPIAGSVRDAHSLFLETAAELGAIGLLILTVFFAWVIGLGARRAFSATPEARPWFAAATAACFAFVVAASSDWVWEVAAIPVVFMLLAGAILAARDDDSRRMGRARRAARRRASASRCWRLQARSRSGCRCSGQRTSAPARKTSMQVCFPLRSPRRSRQGTASRGRQRRTCSRRWCSSSKASSMKPRRKPAPPPTASPPTGGPGTCSRASRARAARRPRRPMPTSRPAGSTPDRRCLQNDERQRDDRLSGQR